MQSILAVSTILIIVISLIEIRVPSAEPFFPMGDGWQLEACQAFDQPSIRALLEVLCDTYDR